MNEKDVSEVRRSLRAEHNAISSVCGCYANANGEIIARFQESFGLMSEEESEKYLTIFRRTLSGSPERNLMDIAFSNNQITDSAEYRLLDTLRKSELKDTDAVGSFFETVTKSLHMEENYVILLTCNKYDIPFKASDGTRLEDGNAVYSYILCSICPVRTTKSALTYEAAKKSFHHNNGANAIQPPELGFLFPAFDNRQTNIYNALLYTRSISESHEDFTDAVFKCSIRMTASTQNETFRTVLAETLEDACSFQVAKNMHTQIVARMEEHKANKEEAPLTISKYEMKDVLEVCGVPEEKLEAFAQGYTESFGAGTDLPPKNIVNPKQFEVRTPDVVIKVAPGREDLVETRVIDGVNYILVRANDGVELNGLNVRVE